MKVVEVPPDLLQIIDFLSWLLGAFKLFDLHDIGVVFVAVVILTSIVKTSCIVHVVSRINRLSAVKRHMLLVQPQLICIALVSLVLGWLVIHGLLVEPLGMEHGVEIVETGISVLLSHKVGTLFELILLRKFLIVLLSKLLLDQLLKLVGVARLSDILLRVIDDRLRQLFVQVVRKREVLNVSLFVEML